jgi:hypothetical protein
MSVDTEIVMSLEMQFAEAVVRCLLANTPLTDYLGGPKVYRQAPESIDEFNVAPSILVWPEPNLFRQNPQPGDYMMPSFTIVVFYIDHNRTRPYDGLELGPMDVVGHCEKVLERGSVGGSVGKFYNPLLSDPTDPLVSDNERFLNRKRPAFKKRSRRIIYRTKTTGWPLLVTFDTTTTREERRLA